MKNFIVALTVSLLISNIAVASHDSVAFFYTAKKVGVQINERGSNGRIQQLMNHLDVSNELYLLSEDETIMLGCARTFEAASCSFRFLPGKDVVIENRSLTLATDLENLGLGELEDFSISFASSMKDRLNLEIKNGKIFITGSKHLK